MVGSYETAPPSSTGFLLTPPFDLLVVVAKSFDPQAGRVYNQTALCLEAAARGDGLTVGDEVTSADYLRSGATDDPLPQPPGLAGFLLPRDPLGRTVERRAVGFRRVAE